MTTQPDYSKPPAEWHVPCETHRARMKPRAGDPLGNGFNQGCTQCLLSFERMMRASKKKGFS